MTDNSHQVADQLERACDVLQKLAHGDILFSAPNAAPGCELTFSTLRAAIAALRSDTRDTNLLPNPIWMARFFHETYERLAPQYGYETRQDTKVFDHESPNGRLMAAVCEEFRKAVGMDDSVLNEPAATPCVVATPRDHWLRGVQDAYDYLNGSTFQRAEMPTVSGCLALIHSLKTNPLWGPAQVPAARATEYICEKCGIRVDPHRCGNETTF